MKKNYVSFQFQGYSGYFKLCLLFFILHFLSCSMFKIDSNKNPKNIILFIGDGMGVSQVSAGRTVRGSLNMEKAPVVGLITTHSANDYITDSAASGTALATGFKTNNGMISISPKGDTLKTVLETAEDHHLSTGLVSTSSITHATPAAFASHVRRRNSEYVIAAQMANLNIEVMFGGGYRFFQTQKDADPAVQDSPFDKLQSRNPVATTIDAFRQLGQTKRACALLNEEGLPRASERDFTLKELTQKAIEILSQNPNGFFLMVEGSQIDWAGHDMDHDYLIEELVDFDDAVGAGLDFAQRNSETLVIITADHETGGYALLDGSIADSTVTKTSFAWDNHTGTMVPLFAMGPGSEVFQGVHDNTFIGQTLIKFIRNNLKE